MHGTVESLVIQLREALYDMPVGRREASDNSVSINPFEAGHPRPAEIAVSVEQQDGLRQHRGVMVGLHASGAARTTASDNRARTRRSALMEWDTLGA